MSSDGNVTAEGHVPDNGQLLGRFLKPVQDFVNEVTQIKWFARAGVEEPWDSEVVRVSDLRDADRKYGEFISLTTAVWKALDSLAQELGRMEAFTAAEDLWIRSPTYVNSGPPGAEDLLTGPVRDDVVGALKEIILDDVIHVRFYRDSIDWYRKGHWRCTITPEGRRVVW